ncbi:hypothetical protein Q5P01_014987 [Channa striata]|uniref:Chemokine interleukin-8-like domain-containing protein n=1 Tax=Channa striata TaxID=64152 RepID=A0AA88MGI7_CHASR|nr:hypothetical protein Q5P01_014987 [Channa striata]
MDLKVALAIVCLCAVAITTTEAGIPKCCISTKSHIPLEILRRAYKVEWQDGAGVCDIDAVLLYIKRNPRPICLNPKFPTFAKVRE